jgi:hypothetical protein
MFRQYTKCYQHTPGDKPFNKSDLAGFVLGTSAPGLIAALVAFLAGASVVGFIFIAIQYATTIIAVANEWLYHRLVCVGDAKCAMGIVASGPERGDLGEFDNDQFFDVRLMPHRAGDDYKAPNAAWGSGSPGPSQDGKTEMHPGNDLYLDKFQGTELLQPAIADLPYDLTRSRLHCEAEGNFWQAMKDFAAILGAAVGVGAGLGAAGGAALGCAIGALFGGIGCIIGAIIGAILGALLGGGAAAYIGANAAFNSDPGNVEDANVGDRALGPITEGDKVVVYGQHVYDGFHEGWHEFHPLMAVMKLDPTESGRYLEWNPDFPDDGTLPSDSDDMDPSIKGLTPDDMRHGLDSDKFRRRAVTLREQFCRLLQEAFETATLQTQTEPAHRWTIHPAVDGCADSEPPPPIR